MDNDKKGSFVKVRKKQFVCLVIIIASLMTVLISSSLFYSVLIPSVQVQDEYANSRTRHQVIAQPAPNNKPLTTLQNLPSILKETSPKTNLTAIEVNLNSQLTLNSTIQPIQCENRGVTTILHHYLFLQILILKLLPKQL
jgi:hypothetical protein